MENVRKFVVETVVSIHGENPEDIRDDTLVPDPMGISTIFQFDFPDGPSLFRFDGEPVTVAMLIEMFYPPGMRKEMDENG